MRQQQRLGVDADGNVTAKPSFNAYMQLFGHGPDARVALLAGHYGTLKPISAAPSGGTKIASVLRACVLAIPFMSTIRFNYKDVPLISCC